MKNVKVWPAVVKYIDKLSDEDAARVRANIQALANDWTSGLSIKILREKIRELVVGCYRIVFFKIGSTIYIIDAFRKKSKKTPQTVIRNAINAYHLLKKS